MATYTDNYQLTKPTYAEQADIGVVNSNMNKIDEVMHSSQISLAPAYDSTQTYAEGDKVMYELLMYKCISPTTGVWDGSKWERTTASESGGGGSAELDILGEASGAVASFSDGASAGLAKCIAEINPTQDLHGYDKPWAPGKGNNKLGISATLPTTINGINFKMENNGKLKVSGLATAEVFLWFNGGTGIILSDGTSYAASIEGIGATTGFEFQICERETSGSGLTYLFSRNSDGTGTFSTHTSWYMRDARIHISNGTNIATPIYLEIMVNEGSTILEWEPYTNICPITGESTVTVTVSDGGGNDTNYICALGRNVYGGRLNVLTGELTITHEIVDLGSLTYTMSASGQLRATYTGVKMVTGGQADAICSSYEVWAGTQPDDFNLLDHIITVGNRNISTANIVVRESSIASATDAPTALNGIKVYFELYTPITVQLTPQEVNSLLGQNNISADTGDIDIVYVKASAPIQPNPTGTPTATLKKLGIEGTVFEVPSGGGGSSGGINYSTTEQRTGQKWIDGKDIYQITIPNISISSQNMQTDLTSLSIDNVIDYKAVYRSSSVGMQLLNEYNDGTDRLSTQIFSNKFRTLCTAWFISSGFVASYTIQYTKITD